MKFKWMFLFLLLSFFVTANFATADDFSFNSTDSQLGGGNGTTGGNGTNGTTTGGGGGVGCVRTQGYWGNSPAGQARLIQLIGNTGLELGNVNYTASEIAEILDQPVQGNALVSLAHQLIAAKLNVLNGADDSQIAADIAAADALIGNHPSCRKQHRGVKLSSGSANACCKRQT